MVPWNKDNQEDHICFYVVGIGFNTLPPPLLVTSLPFYLSFLFSGLVEGIAVFAYNRQHGGGEGSEDGANFTRYQTKPVIIFIYSYSMLGTL